MYYLFNTILRVKMQLDVLFVIFEVIIASVLNLHKFMHQN